MSGEDVRRQWDANTEYWLGKVRTGDDVYREYMNKPYYLDMIGDVSGKALLDLACGEGYFSRIFAQSGAKVTGIDFSGEMIKAAVKAEEETPLGIRYIQADAADLHMLEAGSFDMVCSFMALMDIKDYRGAINEASRVLREDGRFVSIFLHPCFSWRREKEGQLMVDWEKVERPDGLKDYLYLKVTDYLTRHSYEMVWRDEESGWEQSTTQFHRTLSDYVNAFVEAGLLMWRMAEPQPVSEDVPHRMHKLFRVPHSILGCEKGMTSDDYFRVQWDLFAEIWSRDIKNDGNRKYILGPASERMLGDIRGLEVLDLACGEGYFSRLMAAAGAKVIGVDISEKMIVAARSKEEASPLGIEYHVGDASALELESGRFDRVYCSMAFMDIIEYEQAMGEASRVLKEGCRFIFSIVHPCFFSSRTLNGEPMCQTERGEQKEGRRRFLYMKIYDYNKRHIVSTNWMKNGKPYLPSPLANFHRTLSDYVNALGRHGFYITRMDEPIPNEEGISVFKDEKDTRIPNFMMIEAIKRP